MFKPQGRLALSILSVVLIASLVAVSFNGAAVQATTGDFSIGLSNTSIAVPQGSSRTVNLYLSSVNNFDQAVSLAYSGPPPGVTAYFNGNGPSQMVASAGGTTSTALTIYVDPTVATGSYPFIITATSPSGLSHTAALELTVIPSGTVLTTPSADFLTQPSPGVLTLSPSL